MQEKKLFLLDAYALIYRAYYALLRSPRVTSYGFNTSAIFSFCNTLDEVLRKENPDYIAVCFDPPGGRTFRHAMYEAYKAGRDKQPEDITASIPYIKRILEAYRIAVVEKEEYEADDVIGTLSRRAEAEGFLTYMMTPDKDYGQLVTDRVLMFRPSLRGQGFEIRGPREVCERYGIASPRQVIDLLALEGDASDNVPGCPGVGEKTAAKLIAEWGSVENMLANASDIKGALGVKIRDNASQIEMSKELVTICTEVPLDIRLEDLCRREPDADALAAVFDELEFRTMAAKLGLKQKSGQTVEKIQKPVSEPSLFDFSEETDLPVQEDIGASIADVRILADADSVRTFVGSVCASGGNVGFSLNAVGAEAMTARALGLGIAAEEVVYIPFPEMPVLRSEIMEALRPLFSDSKVVLCSADVKRDMVVFSREGLSFAGAGYFDVGVAHYVVAPEMKHDLPALAMTYLGHRTSNYELSAAERRKAQPVAGDEAASFFGEQALLCRRLRPCLESELLQRAQLELLNEIELPFIPVLAAMEMEGARIDVTELRRQAVGLTSRLAALEAEAYSMAGHPFNISSPSQVGKVLFEELAIDPKARKTKGGAWSTTEEILEKYASVHPLVGLILDIRGLRKLLSTYIEALPKLINPQTGKIHTTYNQTVTATGRISSTAPNLQNIPIRTSDGREIRRAFIPDPGDLLLSADYSQIELRLMAHLSGDSGMVEAFRSGADIHRATAAKIFHEDDAEVTEEQRRAAKTANFGIIYGISAFGLAERLGIPRSEAKSLIEGYMSTYPGVASYMEESIEKARTDGFVTTIKGRKRYLPDIHSRNSVVRGYAERNAINAPLQGSAADIIKMAMIAVDREIRRRGLRSRMILQVHDELVFNVKPDELAEVQSMVVGEMEKAYSASVPLEVSAGVGTNWLEAH